jgi:hypothetical protein
MKSRRSTWGVASPCAGLTLALLLLLNADRAALGSLVVLYETGFEAPGFATGQLPGQNGWVAWRGFDESAARVVTGNAASGAQAAMIDGSLTSTPDVDSPWENFYYPGNLFGLDLSTIRATSLTLEVDVRLDLLQPTPDPWIGLAMWTAAGERFAYMTLGGDDLFWFATGLDAYFNVVEQPGVEFGRYYNIRMTYDLIANQASFWVDGVHRATLPYLGPAFAPVLGDVDLLVGTYDGFTRPPVRGYFDNYRITANVIPEPTGLVLMGVGSLGLALWRLGRSRGAGRKRVATAK